MKITDIEHPMRLCVELMAYAGFGANGKTENMRASEIKDAMRVFFTDEEIAEAQRIITGT